MPPPAPSPHRRLHALEQQLRPASPAAAATITPAEHPAFEVLRTEHVLEYGADAVVYRHRKTVPRPAPALPRQLPIPATSQHAPCIRIRCIAPTLLGRIFRDFESSGRACRARSC
jgi:hypothetical protein